MSYSILTPAIVPESIRDRKQPNIGDRFIAESIKALIDAPYPPCEISSWVPLRDPDIEQINSSKCLILGGANPLKDDYLPVPGFGATELRRIRVPILPFGLGLYGEPSRQRAMTRRTRRILLEVHERIDLSAWRCPSTKRYLDQQVPELGPKTRMTGCPVAFIGQKRSPASPGEDIGVVSITERGPDWWTREKAVIDFAARHLDTSRKVLVLHQIPPRPARWPWGRLRGSRHSRAAELHAYAEACGFEMKVADDLRETWDFYDRCKVHVGSRLHAHLYCLAMRKPSFLFGVDGRAGGFAESLGFHLLTGRERDLNGLDTGALVQQRLAELWDAEMKRFVDYARSLAV